MSGPFNLGSVIQCHRGTERRQFRDALSSAKLWYNGPMTDKPAPTPPPPPLVLPPNFVDRIGTISVVIGATNVRKDKPK